jgi:hypothetical protein
MATIDLDRLNLFDQTGFKLPYKKVMRTWFYPRTLAQAEATFLDEATEVLAVEVPGGARAYPVKTIESHHIIQDRIGSREVLVTF